MLICKVCDHPNSDVAHYCEKCGVSLAQLKMELSCESVNNTKDDVNVTKTVTNVARKKSKVFNKRRKVKIVFLVVLLIGVTVYFFPHIEREVYLYKYSEILLTSSEDYQWGVRIFKGRGGNSKVRDVLVQYERDLIVLMLNQTDNYSNARRFYKKGVIEMNDLDIKLIFYAYEKRNFDSLKDKYIVETLEWSYDKKNVHVPTSYEHRLEKDFFGDWYVSTRVSQSAHDYTDYDGAYLHLTVQNKFLALEVIGDVGVSAKEYRDSYDKFSQGLGMMFWGALFGKSGVDMIAKTHDRETSINSIVVEASNEAHQVGKISLLSKRFEDGQEPKISWKSWSIRN